jgi:methionyl-tRNA synthetase
MSEKVIIGGAWPYANGSLHIGHIAGLLPGDVLARYHRAVGNDVYYVSGSDCHGTPICIRAKEEKKSPKEVSDFYHEEFYRCFTKLGFSYDLYGKTSDDTHKDFVKAFHQVLYQSKYVYEETTPQAYCESCNQFLPDRFVKGECPKCGEKSRGDQCDSCGMVLEPKELKAPKCSVCEASPIFKDTKHLYIALKKLGKDLEQLVNDHPEWRKNAIAFTKRYIDEGLRDRALTRDLTWGIEVPKEGYKDKKIYIWAENVLGYLSMSKVVAEKRGVPFEELWKGKAKHYYVHAKDNIPFHTIILPALLLAHGEGYHLPDRIISNEYLTLEGRKISTSENWAIWIKDVIEVYNPDAIRYFLIANGPEKRDTDFSWNEFINSNNGELLGGYGNFVNRTWVFIQKYFEGKVPKGELNQEVQQKIEKCYERVAERIEKGDLKEGLDIIFSLVRDANKYFDYRAPWKTRLEDIGCCKNTLHNCIQIIANLAVLLEPFLPFSSKKIITWLKIEEGWRPKEVKSGYLLPEGELLFERIDKK